MNEPTLNLSGMRRLPIVRQNEAAECGLACLVMVAAFFGYRTDLATLRRRYAAGLRGVTLRMLMDMASDLGLATRPVKVPLAAIGQLRLPAIIHWDMNHFVVLKSVGQRMVVHDPALGLRSYSKEAFSKHFTGVALELSPAEGFQRKKDVRPLRLFDLWGRMHGLVRNFAQIFALSVVLQLFVLASPFYMQVVVDDVLTKFDTDLLLVLALGFGLFTLIQFLAQALRGYVVLYFGSMLSFQMVGNLFHHLLRLPVEFFERRHIGDVDSRFKSAEPIVSMLTEGIVASVIDGLMAVTTLIMMFIYSPLLGAVALAAWLIYLLLRLATYRPFRRAQEDVIVAAAQENTTFIETVRAMTTVHLFGGERERESVWRNRYAEVINTGARAGKYGIWFSAAEAVVFGIEHVALVYLAATMVIDGDFTVGMIFAFMAYKRSFTDKASALVEKLIEFRMLSLHLERIADIAGAEPEETDTPSPMPPPVVSGGLELRGIHYRYDDSGAAVLRGVDLEVRPGECVAVIGPSGCGKTTLLKVMTGLFSPEEGSVLIDDVPLSRYGLRAYRQQVGTVMQEEAFLTGSIAENIAFFDPEIDMGRVIWAARAAVVHDEIAALPMNYDSLVGDMGAALSGGQKQRIALARALYRQPRILFMDEGTAHLDVATEKAVAASIARLGITRIIIAHRPETIASADRVFELADGRVRVVDGLVVGEQS